MDSKKFDQFLCGVRLWAEKLAPLSWRSGEDAEALLFYETVDGEQCFVSIDREHLASPEAKTLWCMAHLPVILQSERAVCYAIVAEAWSVKPGAVRGLSDWYAEGHTTLAVHPSRVEQLVIMGFTRGRSVVLCNEIRRVGQRQRRRLTCWSRRVVAEAGALEGRYTLGVGALVDSPQQDDANGAGA